jgi:hypothetical protein
MKKHKKLKKTIPDASVSAACRLAGWQRLSRLLAIQSDSENPHRLDDEQKSQNKHKIQEAQENTPCYMPDQLYQEAHTHIKHTCCICECCWQAGSVLTRLLTLQPSFDFQI